MVIDCGVCSWSYKWNDFTKMTQQAVEKSKETLRDKIWDIVDACSLDDYEPQNIEKQNECMYCGQKRKEHSLDLKVDKLLSLIDEEKGEAVKAERAKFDKYLKDKMRQDRNPSFDTIAGTLYWTLGKVLFYDEELKEAIQVEGTLTIEVEKMIRQRGENQQYMRMILDDLKRARKPHSAIEALVTNSEEK